MKIAVIGGYGIGMTMRVARAPRAGETVSGGTLAVGPGGKGSNQAIAAARLGAAVSLLTSIGADESGDSGRRLWSEEGVDSSRVVTGTSATMTGFIIVGEDGENRIAIAPGALEELTPEHVEAFRAEIAAADVLLVSLEIPSEAAAAALRIAREVGTRSILNPAPAAEVTSQMLRDADIITPNLSEAAALAGLPADTAPEVLGRALALLHEGPVVLTLGSSGSIVVDGDSISTIPAVTAGPVVDTVGAGDAFSAALAVMVAEGKGLVEAAAFAACAGAVAVTVEQVIPALPYRTDVENLLSQQKQQKEPHV